MFSPSSPVLYLSAACFQGRWGEGLGYSVTPEPGAQVRFLSGVL